MTNVGTSAQGINCFRTGGLETIQLLRRRDNSSGTNYLFRDLASTDTQGPMLKIEQENSGDDQPCLYLQQDATAAPFINFHAGDRGVINGATNSIVSVRVALGGTVYRLALYVDA